MSVEQIGNLIKIEFNNSVMPSFVEKRNKDWVYYGEKNNYPQFIIDIYNKHPVHSSIIKSKVKYIAGKGLTINPKDYNALVDAVRAESFLNRANRFEDWSSVFEKTAYSLEIYNGFAWQIIWNIGGTKCEVYPMQFSKLRRSADKQHIYYSDKWTNEEGYPITSPKYQEFCAFNPNNRKGTQIYYYTVTDQYSDGVGDVYPLPEYKGAIINIYTDIAIAEFQNNLALHGMTAQGMLTLFKGEPTEEERRKLDKLFNNKFTGPAGSKVILNFTNDQGDRGAEWTTFQTTDLDKQFELISKNNQQSIITGHQIPNKSLVGISVEGALSDRTAIDVSFEQLQNTYVEPRQTLILNEVKMIGEICGVNLEGITVKRLKPLGVDYLDANVTKYLTEDEVRLGIGLEPKEKSSPSEGALLIEAINSLSPLVANKVLESMSEDEIRKLVGLRNKNEIIDPVSGEVKQKTEINENLQGLTGKDWIHIKRLIREVKTGKTTRETAALMIRSAYGLGDDDINILFGNQGEQVVQFSAHKMLDEILKMYEDAAIDDNDDPEIEGYEFEKVSILESQVLDLLKGEPEASAWKLSQMLETDISEIELALSNLQKRGYIDGNFQPTQAGIEAKTKTPDVEVYTVYKYVTRDDVPRASKSRPFCSRLLELTASGKVWTKEAIDNLSNQFGEDAWSYRGGFYTNPDTGETTTYCRHFWKSIVKSRRK